MRRTRALIAGGGPAGAIAAMLIARDGERPLVLERTHAPQDALCGGFLSWRTLETLARAGVDPAALDGHAVRRARLFAGTRQAEAMLPAPAIGLSRRVLDAVLIDHARTAGAAIERGVAIRAAEGRTLRTGDGATIVGDALFLATGKHDLRGLVRPVPVEHDPAMGVRVRLAAAPALTRMVGDAIELHLFDGGYAGLVLQEDGSANLCMALRRSRLTAMGTLPALLDRLADECPALGDRLAHMAPGAPIDAIANVPYGWRTADTAPGIFRLGDQAGVIPSLAGEGMGIAIASGVRAARAFARSGAEGAAGYQRDLARAMRRPLGVAGVVRALAERPVGGRILLGGARLPGLLTLVATTTRIGSPGD